MLGSNTIKVQRKQSLRLALTLRNTETSVPLNLAGCAFSVEDNELPFTPTLTVVDASGGRVNLTAPKSSMSTLAPEKQYSLKIAFLDAGGNDFVFPALTLEIWE